MVTTRQTESSVSILMAPNSPSTMPVTIPKPPSPVQLVAPQASASPKKRVMAPPPRPRRRERFAVKKSCSTKFSKKQPKDETVEVVKMLTGILYLYRGVNRRVEFVRKV